MKNYGGGKNIAEICFRKIFFLSLEILVEVCGGFLSLTFTAKNSTRRH